MLRKKYSKEFKLDAFSLVLEQGYRNTEGGKSRPLRFYFLCSHQSFLQLEIDVALAISTFIIFLTLSSHPTFIRMSSS